MVSKQQWFLALEKPLDRRSGRHFSGKSPNVYFQRVNQKTIYIGQSKNLHHWLLSYQNAHPNHSPGRVLRFVQSMHHISWEALTDVRSGVLLENELLRTLKPRFLSKIGSWRISSSSTIFVSTAYC
ncbi:MAG: UvrABC system protein C [Verrucomicrobia subdivision 3 bacterium]|nr:UvrABC system protein C [Limisphaerales bacterium]MCS1412742.1 UvrABC system protein C [Limisphaerales bacterium]